ncbi:MAG TPA: hypothetical protein VFN78_09785 [Ktedonobacterales bacterium]|nr:hypothetical protein [Ktedonobacterales bacterium]
MAPIPRETLARRLLVDGVFARVEKDARDTRDTRDARGVDAPGVSGAGALGAW